MTRASSDAPALHACALRAAAYVSAGLGVAAAGAALGVYLWNRGRYEDWQAGDAAVEDLKFGSAAYRKQVTENNDLASSLISANKAILGLSIAGGLLVATGATLWLVDRGRARPAGELAFSWTGSSARSAGAPGGETPFVRRGDVIVCALAAPGCFDVRLRDPGPLSSTTSKTGTSPRS